MHRPFRRIHPLILVALTLTLGSLIFGAKNAHAATSCYAESCGTSCSPDLPVDISTLLAPADFPVGATTPIAFVDPGDGQGRRLIATQQGAILLFEHATGAIAPTFFLDLRDDVGGPVLAGGERGLLALAVDPDYAVNGRFYVFYTRAGAGDLEGDVVIERYERSAADPNVADPASATTILVIEHTDRGNHNGGWLAFGPDGFLYISTGDGGSSCDDQAGASGDGQVNTTLAGKILRLDVRGIDGAAGAPDDCSVEAGPYGVPSDNPFFGQEPACDEVWALGLRNPFRFSFDRATGDLWLGDIGQAKWEEINLKAAATPAPVNFGWVCREGCESSNNGESSCSLSGCPVDTGTTCEFPRTSGFWDPPLCHYNGDTQWRSVMAGYRYRGDFVPSIAGDFLYTDAYCGQIWKTDTVDTANPAAITASCWASGFSGAYGFAEDHYGEIYVVVGGAGRIDCIHNGDGCPWATWEVFADGFESGDLATWDSVTP